MSSKGALRSQGCNVTSASAAKYWLFITGYCSPQPQEPVLSTEHTLKHDLTKAQGQKLGFNLKIQKAKQAVTGSYLDLSLKWQPCLLESQNETVSESCFPVLYSSLGLGLKAWTTWFLWQLVWFLGLKVCYHNLVCKDD